MTQDTSRPIQIPVARRGAWLGADAWAIAVLGLVIGAAVRGHFCMPHSDFLEFVDSGHAWLAGEFAGNMKRAPLFPLLVVLLGKLAPGPAPELLVAEWLNVALLACNGLLVYWIARPWLGRVARWAAVWFLLLPMGVYCTAHVIVEPLLTTMILVTVLLAARKSRWTYLAAAGATMTRYDAAGLIVGLALAELWRMAAARRQAMLPDGEAPEVDRNTWRGVALRTLLAFAPLVIWLLITALTWAQRSHDHYIAQIVERPAFNLLYALRIGFETAFPADLLCVPAWWFLADCNLRFVMLVVPVVLAIGGVCWRWRAGDMSVLVGLAFFAGYVVVHAVFPFELTRFGYPPAPVLLLWALAGAAWIARWGIWRRVSRGVAAWLILALLGMLFALALVDEAQAFATATGGAGRFVGRAGMLAIVALTLVWATPWLTRRRLGRVVVLLGMVLLVVRQFRAVDPLIGAGDGLLNQVRVACWIQQHATQARVLSDEPGLLRLYVGRDKANQFLGFGEIKGATWDEVITDCRARGVELIIWNKRCVSEHGNYYATKWGLERFRTLDTYEATPGVRLEQAFPGKPNLIVVRLLP